MEKINVNLFTGLRLISVLTPGSFLRPLIVVSTVFDTTTGEGETATAEVEGLNAFSIDYNRTDFKAVKKHTDLKEAMKFHNDLLTFEK